MIGIREAIRKIYSGSDILQKHIILFILIGIPAMFSAPLNDISKVRNLPGSTILLTLLALLVILVIGFYLSGFYFKMMHNAFNGNHEELLPEFDKDCFKVFWKAFPLQLAWLIYLICITAGVFLIMLVLKVVFSLHAAKLFVIVVPAIIFAFFALGLPLVYAAFAKNYNRKGLYNIALPVVYIFKSGKNFWMLVLKIIPVFLIIVIVNIFGHGNSVIAYIFTALGAYLTTMMQYIFSICCVDIYKERLESRV